MEWIADFLGDAHKRLGSVEAGRVGDHADALDKSIAEALIAVQVRTGELNEELEGAMESVVEATTKPCRSRAGESRSGNSVSEV